MIPSQALILPGLLLLAFDLVLIRRLAHGFWRTLAETIGLLATQAGALWLAWPFFTTSHIGSGDSYAYTLQLADFLEQVRHGVFPVFAGQSEFAFNGNVHTVRSAPYFVHFGGLMQLLTRGQLTPFGIQNLSIVASFVGGATTCYTAVRLVTPRWRWAAPPLAAFYLLCPATMIILAAMDMIATVMTLPWIPVFWGGIACALLAGNEGDDTRPLLFASAGLALVWYSHPAIGAWLTPCWILALFVRLLVARGSGRFRRPLFALASFGVLAVYLFVSVATLKLNYPSTKDGAMVSLLFDSLGDAFPAAWYPLVAPTASLGNVQLGWGLIGLAGICFLLLWRSRLVGAYFLLVLFSFVLLLTPYEFIKHVWSALPETVLNATNTWPMQRFYPLLAAMIPIWAAVTLRGFRARIWLHALAVLALAGGVYWGVKQEKIPRAHAKLVTRTPAGTVNLLEPSNVSLGRGAYLFFRFFPIYYSHGVMDPAFETRLLNAAMDPVMDNASALVKQRGTAAPFAEMTLHRIPELNPNALRREATFTTDGHSRYILAFAFPTPPAGEFQLFGQTLYRTYTLPEFGLPKAFGAGAASTPYLPLTLPPGETETIKLWTEIQDLSAKVYAYQPDELAIRTKSLVPLRLELTAVEPGFVETPRVFIPGYRATVNGAKVETVKSKQGLVAVPVPAGALNVTLNYVGPFLLRLCYWISLASLVAVVTWLVCPAFSFKTRN